MNRPLVLALTVLVFTSLMSAQEQKVLAPHKPIAPRVPKSREHHEPGVLRSMVGGFWMIDANRKASIYLRNGLETSSITVTPSVYLSNGARYRVAPVSIEASGTAVLSINDLLQQQGISSWATLSGYVEVEYTWAWDPLCVTVTSVDPVHSVIFTSSLQPSLVEPLRVHLSKPQVEGMYAVDGMWWKPEAGISGFVGLSNTTSAPVDAHVQMSDGESKPLEEYRVRVSPHGTKIVALRALEWAAVGSSGGLRVLHTGSMEGLVISAGLEDQSSGYSANLPFHYTFSVPPRQTGLEAYAELGLMTGAADPMMRFPAGTVFTPFSVARNVSDQPVSVTPRIYWMQGGATRSARLQPFSLLPYEARTIDVPSLLEKAGLSAFNGAFNLILEAQGNPRSLLLASGSVDQRNTYVFQVLPHGVQESNAKTISYWSAGNGDDTMVTIWNPADEAQDFSFTLFFTGGHYRLPIHLEARATRTFNISEIIQNQLPDDEGNLIPPNAQEGSAKIAGTHADNEEILVAVDAGTYNVRKATCSYYCISCDGAVSAFIDTTPWAVAKGNTNQLTFMLNENTGGQYYSSGTWSSSHTTVATVNSSSGLVSGVSPGSATITAYNDYVDIYDSSYCAYDPFCPAQGYQSGGGGGTVISATISIQSSGTIPAADTARGEYYSVVGSYSLGNQVDSGGYCTIGYQATGTLNPSSYTGTVTLVRTKGGVDYDGTTGQTVLDSYSTGTNDSSEAAFEVTTPTNGVVYDLDAPGMKPTQNQIWRKRMNFFENAQLPDGTYVANEVGFYVRLSCVWGSSGNTFGTGVSGDNVLGMGTTKTSWNLQ